MRIMVDTCIVIDAIQKREPFYNDAKELLELIQNEKVEGYITVKELTDIHYVIKHVTHDENKTRMIMNNLIELFTILDSKSEEAKLAINSKMVDYEDALMYETAYSNEADCIVTRNVKDFKNTREPITVATPKQFIKMWEELC